MKAIVLRTFKDGLSSSLCEKGEELTLTKARFDQINSWAMKNYNEPFLDEVELPPATGKGTRAVKGKA